MTGVRSIYYRRNELLKGGGGMAVTADELTKSASLAQLILEHELQSALLFE